jgi:hypothetical protein
MQGQLFGGQLTMSPKEEENSRAPTPEEHWEPSLGR